MLEGVFAIACENEDRPGTTMIGTVGDLVEDIVVRLAGPVNAAADTEAVVLRRRGGSAANMAVAVARTGQPARFIGQLGDDHASSGLVAALRGEGVDVVGHVGGRTGTIVVLVDHHGERTMLTDRGACADLDQPEPSWLDGLATLHVPVYSLVGEPLAGTATTLIEWAHRRGITVSIDASSSSVIERFGVDAMIALLRDSQPSVLLCNEMEAATLGRSIDPGPSNDWITVVKRGAKPAIVLRSGTEPVHVPALPVADVRDTTGAGDAFAAGFLIALAAGGSAVDAAMQGHETAAAAIRAASEGG
jgi:sugar/nucleoside kinase (ribokinase family)